MTDSNITASIIVLMRIRTLANQGARVRQGV